MLSHLHRLDKGDLGFQTLGELRVFNTDHVLVGDPLFTVEPPWKLNRQNVSCIANGRYDLVKRWSEDYGNHFHVLDTYGRTLVLFHIGNFRKDTRGCILPGQGFYDIDEDSHLDTTSSGDTMEWLNRTLPFKSELLITSEFALNTF